MSRRLPLPFLIGLVGFALLALLALLRQPVMPAYLAAWLFWMSLPLGALPLVMLLELLGVRDWPLLPVLRRLLLLLPPGALLALPLMLRAAPLFIRPGLPQAWSNTPFLLVRMATMLVLWSALALLFCRYPKNGPRRGACVAGLMLHLVMATIAGLDWLLSLDPGFGSSLLGLLLIAIQVSVALCTAAFLLALLDEVPAEIPPLMIGLLFLWLFLHFSQYLVTWSANLPREIVWYQVRALGLGTPLIWAGAAASVLALALLLPYRLARIPTIMASVAAMLLLGHAAEVIWLVTPPFRGTVAPTWSDLPALAAIGGLAVFMLASISARPGNAPA